MDSRRPEWLDTVALVAVAAAVVLTGTGAILAVTRPDPVVIVQQVPATTTPTTRRPPVSVATGAPYTTTRQTVPPTAPPVSLDIDFGSNEPSLCETMDACRDDG